MNRRAFEEVIARAGGEEFCLILPDSNRDKALEAAEKIRLNVAGLRIEADSAFPQITVSLGVAIVDSDDDDYQAALEQADEALYRAKTQGRNRVCFGDSGS